MNAKFFDSVFFAVLFLISNPGYLRAMDPGQQGFDWRTKEQQVLQSLSEKHRDLLLSDFKPETVCDGIYGLALNNNAAYQAFFESRFKGREHSVAADQGLEQQEAQGQIEQEFVIALFHKIAESKRTAWKNFGLCGYAMAGVGCFGFVVGMCVTMLNFTALRPCP
jgi:hypothetical protein